MSAEYALFACHATALTKFVTKSFSEYVQEKHLDSDNCTRFRNKSYSMISQAGSPLKTERTGYENVPIFNDNDGFLYVYQSFFQVVINFQGRLFIWISNRAEN